MKQRLFLLILIAMLTHICVWANTLYVDDIFTYNGITYKAINTNPREVQVGAGTDLGTTAVDKTTDGTIVLPSIVQGTDGNNYSVKSIGFAAFFQCSGLTSVVIPNSVTTIGNSGFGRCSSLTSIIIPNSVKDI